MDNDFISVEDYSLMVSNIDHSIKPIDLKNMIEQTYANSGVQIEYINYCYKINDYVKSEEHLKGLFRQKEFYKYHRDRHLRSIGKTVEDLKKDESLYAGPHYKLGCCKTKQIDHAALVREISETETKIEDFLKVVQTDDSLGHLFTGRAFVVFKTPCYANIVLNANKSATAFGRLFRKICCGCCSGTSLGSMIFEKAPEPNDIFFENMQYTFMHKVCMTFVTYSVSFILVGACFGIIWALNVGKNNYVAKHGTEANEKTTTNILSVVIAIVI